MRIFSSLFLLFYLGLGTAYSASSPMQFLASHGVPEDMISAIRLGQTIVSCQEADSWLVCIDGLSLPDISVNPLSSQAILKGQKLKVRNAMANFLAKKVRAKNLHDPSMVGKTLASSQNLSTSRLKGLEFLTFCEGDWCGGITAIKNVDAGKNLPPVYESAVFIQDYSKACLDKIRLLLQNRQGNAALGILKELRSLDSMNPDVDILAAQAFLLEKRNADAMKIANALYKSSRPLNAEQLEELGDLFLNLGHDKEALELYTRASALLTSKEKS